MNGLNPLIVPVLKGDGNIRLCGDYKVTINPSLEVNKYPLPKPDELFASLAGGKRFSKLDLSQAYQQMLLSEESQPFTTTKGCIDMFICHLELIASAPAIFQQSMDTILAGNPHVICYIDDILITGATEELLLESGAS